MSHKGKLQRGEHWWKKRDVSGELPLGVKNDPVKMADLDYFLGNQKKPDVPEPVKEKGKK